MYNKICFCITNEQHFSIFVLPSDSISDRMSSSQVLFLVSIVLIVTLFFSLYEEICHTHLHDKFPTVGLWEQPATALYCHPLIVCSLPQFLPQLYKHVKRKQGCTVAFSSFKTGNMLRHVQIKGQWLKCLLQYSNSYSYSIQTVILLFWILKRLKKHFKQGSSNLIAFLSILVLT